ncbi:MAG TPA: DUF4124 domain-containing protein [Geobacteraceae bacterium]
MRLLIALFVTTLACTAARADVYEWVDGQGVVHFTDNPDKVPAGSRTKVKMKGPAAAREEAMPPAQEKPPVATPPPPEKKAELYGGHDGNWWRASFRQVRDDLKSLQDQLPAKKEALAALHRKRVIYQRARDRVASNDLAAGIAGDEEKIKTLQEQLATLEADADKAGVPPEWRK